ncbi:3-phosphoshikimate 1-carboxyvinyltransferase [Calderihabitans maritimus]|uniref:3-phosphoshikimate 1-carboxyvinyltransferase n=1 Tax=Calderihabitans maritimus TaxID=1246530 RepID=A0A1Z5HUM8_9FIRM|nr:3-phosphoshikimate 1-carboxyvinyltransferase [Calderihabitans maritimus]GAW93224.1 3-phosphoshikimate 1-carboxyvinyltransferase [Calderihabitans maritimus]
MELQVKPSGSLKGEIRVPGDKSISHRAVMLGALASGTTEIEGFLRADDCFRTVNCMRALGVQIEEGDRKNLIVRGAGLEGLVEPVQVLEAGNSGTTMRLLLGILAGQPVYSVITGDESLRRRPMDRVSIPLREMGARIFGRRQASLAPLTVVGGSLRPITYHSPVASAQVKSAILLAGLFSEGITTVVEPAKSRDHTERMLRAFGARLEEAGLRVSVQGRPRLFGQKVVVPGDISSAAFFLVAGSIVPGSEILLRHVGLNPTRTGILDALSAMGAKIQVLETGETAGELYGDLLVSYSYLKGTTIQGDLIPRLIDEIPVLAVAAAVAQGRTVIKDAAELKVKESNRIRAMVTELGKMGVQIEELPDGMVIEGGRPLQGTILDSYGDHRIAMSLAVAGLVARGETIIKGAESIKISFPDFPRVLKQLQSAR